jgi:hypothetical protein
MPPFKLPGGDVEKKPPKKCLECRKKKGFILSYMTQIIAYLLLELHTCELSTFVCSSRMLGLRSSRVRAVSHI